MVTMQERAEIWEVVVRKREERGDEEGAEKARYCAQVNREGLRVSQGTRWGGRRW